MTKNCLECGGVTVRAGTLSDKQWERIRFCSRSCGNRWRWKQPSGLADCAVCGKPFQKKIRTQKHCTDKCSWIASKNGMGAVATKANSLGGSIRLDGKRAIIEAMLGAALDKPCAYCGAIITLKTASLDHMEPLRGLHRAIGALRRPLDRASNLQIVCRTCNTAKSDMSDGDFKKLLAFLRANPPIYSCVWPRLRSSGHAWAQIKANNKQRKWGR